MPFKKPPLPKILTNKDWQKKKGLIAKMSKAGKTGVGAAMDEMSKSYDAVDWKKLNISESTPMGAAFTRQALERAKADAVAEFNSKVEGDLRKKIQAVRTKASQTATEWSKSKTIPSKSTAHAQAVASAADTFMVACNKNTLLSQIAKDYQDNLKGIETREKVYADTAKRLKGYLASTARLMKTVKTAKDFNGTFWGEHVRGVGTTLPLVSKQLGIVAEHKQWRTFASQGFQPKTDDEVQPKLNQMKPVLKRIATAVG